MGEAFRLGGWGMYPTAITGLILFVTAVRYAIAPDDARALVVRRLATLTFLTGCLGFVTGLIRTCLHATELPASDLGGVIVTGFGESLHNIGLALTCLVAAGIATAIGATRRGTHGDGELIAP